MATVSWGNTPIWYDSAVDHLLDRKDHTIDPSGQGEATPVIDVFLA